MSTKRNQAACGRTLALSDKGAAPTEVLLIPAGQINARDGRSWVNNNPGAILAAFDADGMDLPIDYEHAIEVAERTGQPIPAAGWIKGLTERDGAVWASVNWTDRAEEMIEAREYRFVSPVFWFDEEGSIFELSSVALTNDPAIRQPALASRTPNPDTSKPEEPAMDKAARKTLCTKLGLAEEASDTSIQEAVDKALASSKTPPLEQFVPRADHDKLKEERDQALASLKKHEDDEVEALVDAAVAAKKIAPASKAYHLAACKNEGGVDAFKAMVGELPVNPITQPSDLDGKNPPNAGGALTAEEKAICKNLGLTHEQFIKERDGEKAA
jgi:phage I-like protein